MEFFNWERRGASSQESFCPQSYGTFKQRDNSEINDFFDMVYRTKKNIFDFIIDIRDYPAQPGRNALWRGISQSVQKIQIWNFYAMWL